MDYFTKRRILIWALVALVILNISTLGTIWIMNRPAQAPQTPPHIEDIEFRGVNHFIRNEVGFTDEQWQEFVELRKKSMSETHSLMMEMNQLRQEMYDELASNTPNENKLEKIALQMGTIHGQVKRLSTQFFTDVHKICTPEQKNKLNLLYNELKNTQRPPRHGNENPFPGRRHRMRQHQNP